MELNKRHVDSIWNNAIDDFTEDKCLTPYHCKQGLVCFLSPDLTLTLPVPFEILLQVWNYYDDYDLRRIAIGQWFKCQSNIVWWPFRQIYRCEQMLCSDTMVIPVYLLGAGVGASACRRRVIFMYAPSPFPDRLMCPSLGWAVLGGRGGVSSANSVDSEFRVSGCSLKINCGDIYYTCV